MISKISPCLWFDTQAEDAAKFYTSIFKDAKIVTITRYPDTGQEIHGKPAGSVLTVEFELNGQSFTALNGGPHFKFTEAVSFQIECETQAEVDYFRNKGMNIIRLPFRWERLQQTTNAAFNSAELNRLHTFVAATTAKGVYVILEPHNFARYYPDPSNFQTSMQGLVGSYYPDSVFWKLLGSG